MSTTTTAPAGWYPNPLDATTQRWWDGVSWTEHLTPVMVAAEETAPVAEIAPAFAAEPSKLTLPSFDTLPGGGTSYSPFPESIPSVPWAPAASTTAWPTTVQSPNTIWIWLLAFAPLITGIAVGVAQGLLLVIGMATAGAGSSPGVPLFIGLVIGLIPVWVFAGLDIRALRQRGYHTTSILFMLLAPPLVYFAVRARRLSRDGVRSRGPELAFLIVIAINIALGIIRAIGVVSPSTPPF